MKKIIPTLFLLALTSPTEAQVSRLVHDVQYSTSVQGTAANGDAAPFWFTSNRYGLFSEVPNQGLVRAAIHREVEADSLRKWRIGYGLDLAAGLNVKGVGNQDLRFALQQLYGDFQHKAIRLSIGQKERSMELKDQQLSSGGMTASINARPLPQIRLELPDFWTIPRTKGWLAVKAHIAYGMYTDNRWQRNFTEGTNNLYTANSFFHSKAGFLRVGNTDKFPVTLTGGLEMSSQFGGEAWNLQDRPDHVSTGTFDPHQKLSNGIKAFWHAFIPGGGDVNDGDYTNVEGNQLGSWHVRLDYHGKEWGAAFYAEHFFEDHSQMFWQYPWKDMLYGIEVQMPKNPVLGTLVYEHLSTTDQSGPIYHDGTATIPDNIYGIDNYYNHQVYGGWQHAGHAIGNALLISPLYNTNGKIEFRHTRVRAHHVGLAGQPHKDVAYRILYTHEKSLGTYYTPLTDPQKGDFLLLETTFHPHQVEGLSLTASYGQNWGKLLGKAKGAMLTVAYSGWIKKK